MKRARLYVKENKMSSAINYTNIESTVTAYQLSSATSNEIGSLLIGEAANSLLASFTANYNNSTGTHTYKFRYKDDSVVSTLNESDYLVLLNTGKYVAYTAKAFEDEYIDTNKDVVPIQAKTPLESFTAFIQKTYTDLAVTDTSDCLTKMPQIVEKLRTWYTDSSDTLTLNFTNYAMVDPKGINKIINPFIKATYVKDTTKIVLSFGNIGPESRNIRELDRTNINSFNLIALQELVGELKKLDKNLRSKITAASFIGTNGAPSSVSSAVTEGQWLDIIDELRNVTGIGRNSGVTR